MTKLWVLTLGVFLLFTSIATAQNSIVVTDFRSSVFGGASWVSNCKGFASADGTEVTLSQVGKSYCAGSVLVTAAPICAQEYTVSFEFSSASATGTGDIAIEEILARPEGYTSADLDHYKVPVVNRTYYFSATNAPAQILFGNNFNLAAPPVTVLKSTAPFSVRGKGWQKMAAHITDSRVEATILSGNDSTGMIGSKISTLGKVKYPYIIANTVSPDLVKIRNLKVDILKADNCTGLPSLSLEEARQKVTDACGAGDCAENAAFLSCASTTLEALRAAGTLDPAIQKTLLDEFQVKSMYCSGLDECKADMESAKQEAFETGLNLGVASIDQEAIKAQAYQQGFDAGKASVVCSNKVTICHVAGKKTETIEVSINALPAHLAHGDSLGACK